eukprot:CAMPEP_0202404572 /NCGR_PEP_ID=MMETSP1128-20130828/5770_1 /ASSEMBLY_ACC=CAM_ASM_000463 /TAXON_ID=3047 /ORGANISM="Dunaliella tertiolecta, Strain CCMP1320" /LENGTH=103 /DNA_ID=CAMNT_0049009063 /DNA_START=37 /DNA_END=344 /DNA_ORIENTATION=+
MVASSAQGGGGGVDSSTTAAMGVAMVPTSCLAVSWGGSPAVLLYEVPLLGDHRGPIGASQRPDHPHSHHQPPSSPSQHQHQHQHQTQQPPSPVGEQPGNQSAG